MRSRTSFSTAFSSLCGWRRWAAYFAGFTFPAAGLADGYAFTNGFGFSPQRRRSGDGEISFLSRGFMFLCRAAGYAFSSETGYGGRWNAVRRHGYFSLGRGRQYFALLSRRPAAYVADGRTDNSQCRWEGKTRTFLRAVLRRSLPF